MKITKEFCETIVTALIAGLFVGLLLVQGCTEYGLNPISGQYQSPPGEPDFDTCAERPPTTRTLYAMARVLAAQGKDAQAEILLRRVIQDQPEFLPARNTLAEIQMRQRRVREAVATISAGLEVNPADAVLLNNLGMCQMVLGQYEKALETFTAAAAARPGNARYRANMAVALGLMGRDHEAINLYKQVLPEQKAIHNLLVLQSARDEFSAGASDVTDELLFTETASP